MNGSDTAQWRSMTVALNPVDMRMLLRILVVLLVFAVPDRNWLRAEGWQGARNGSSARGGDRSGVCAEARGSRAVLARLTRGGKATRVIRATIERAAEVEDGVVPWSMAGGCFKRRGRYTTEKGHGARGGNGDDVGEKERQRRMVHMRCHDAEDRAREPQPLQLVGASAVDGEDKEQHKETRGE
ncbi:hypothetical protein K438DRAFT_1782137 [Mycena galopus ATCC 62051]|nr:hypothetical protein K438DRAFT_1782137 [Mycena galopus ATCC 62051]